MLGPDRDQAGLKYEGLRRKLVRFFEWRNCHPAEELADQTLDRVSRKLAEGVEIHLSDPGPYVYGVARNIARETLAQATRRPQPASLAAEAERALNSSLEPTSEDLDRALHCLDHCLEAMPMATRQLVLLYHGGEGRGPGRKRLLAGLRIPPGALWVRMHRLRKRLEHCVRGCMDGSSFAPAKGIRPLRHSSVKEGDEP